MIPDERLKLLGGEIDCLPDFKRGLEIARAVKIKRGLEAAVEAGGEGVEGEAGVPGLDGFGLKVAQTINFVSGLFDDLELISLGFGTQVGDEHLAFFFVGIGIDSGDDGPAATPEDEVAAFAVVPETFGKVNRPFGVDLVEHEVIISC